MALDLHQAVEKPAVCKRSTVPIRTPGQNQVARTGQNALRDRPPLGASTAAGRSSGRAGASSASSTTTSQQRSRSGAGAAPLGGLGQKTAAAPNSGSMARNSLRSQNLRLQSESSQTHSSKEAQRRDNQDVVAQSDQERHHVEALEACVEKLQVSLTTASQRNQLLEDHVVSSQDARPKASGADAGSAGPDETATGVPSSDRSTKTLEDMDSDAGVELVSESSLVSQVAHDCTVDSAAYSTPPCGGGGDISSPGRSSSNGAAAASSNGASPEDAKNDGYLEDLWDFVIQGQLSHEEQPDFANKVIACFPSSAMERARARDVACISTRGLRLDATVPNQDDFLLAMRAPVAQGHVALYGVFDGHGPTGHSCAAFARSYLPECIFSDSELFARPRHVLRRAFAQTQEALLQQPFNVQVSGTTATLALVVDTNSASGCDRLYVAHIGDSRAILASRREKESAGGSSSHGSFVVSPLTREHRPDDPREEERVTAQGGEIRRLAGQSCGAGRVFVKGRNHPALALTRSLGDAAAAECGVLSEPDITGHRLRPGSEALLVLGTDGLFEFCGNRDVASPLLRRGVCTSVLEEISLTSRQRWAENSLNQTVDDITVVAVSLSSHFG